jgi:hypothetical protein
MKIFKRPADKGLVVAWDNGGGTKQPQITLDYDEAPIAKVMDMKIKTEAKPVVATPEPTVEPTVTPSVQPEVQPEQQAPVVEEQKVEVKENDMVEQDLDEVPKTADASNITLVYQLLGASAFTMLWLGAVTVIKRRRENI